MVCVDLHVSYLSHGLTESGQRLAEFTNLLA
jgi:hypothetical protein